LQQPERKKAAFYCFSAAFEEKSNAQSIFVCLGFERKGALLGIGVIWGIFIHNTFERSCDCELELKRDRVRRKPEKYNVRF